MWVTKTVGEGWRFESDSGEESHAQDGGVGEGSERRNVCGSGVCLRSAHQLFGLEVPRSLRDDGSSLLPPPQSLTLSPTSAVNIFEPHARVCFFLLHPTMATGYCRRNCLKQIANSLQVELQSAIGKILDCASAQGPHQKMSLYLHRMDQVVKLLPEGKACFVLTCI